MLRVATLVALGELAASEPDDPLVVAVRQASAGLVKAAKRSRRVANRAKSRVHDGALVAETFVFRQPTDASTLNSAPEVSPLGAFARPRRCYVCKAHFVELNSHYHLHCARCAAIDRAERDARVDKSGRRVIVTGGRIKIGFHTTLKLLRDGADVIITTRFPVDARRRFAAVPDATSWHDRLLVCGLDLCDVQGLHSFIDDVSARWEWLDIVVCNAASTVRRQPEYYARELSLGDGAVALPSLGGRRGAPFELGTRDAAWRAAAELLVDETGEALDMSATNSWTRRLGEISGREVIENYLVGAFAPFEMLNALLPLLERSPHADRHAVIVSAVEGQFAKPVKMAGHPHTNMTKAAANMLVRSCADDLATRRIFLNAVDTGWINDENPHGQKLRNRDRGFRPPLDVVDGAARIYHPIRVGRTDAPLWGQFLKNYASAPW